MPLLPPPIFPSIPKITGSCFKPRSSFSAALSCSCFCIYLFLILLGLLYNAIGRLFSMAQLNSARNFFERARIKGSESNKDTVNGEEVKKELSDSTKRGYRRSLALRHQWVDRSAPQERTGILTVQSLAIGIRWSTPKRLPKA